MNMMAFWMSRKVILCDLGREVEGEREWEWEMEVVVVAASLDDDDVDNIDNDDDGGIDNDGWWTDVDECDGMQLIVMMTKVRSSRRKREMHQWENTVSLTHV